MGGIDPQKLDYLRSGIWQMEEPCRNPRPDTAAEYRRDLAAMGLDLNDDATYELLQDGLTKKKFDDLEFLAVTYFVTRSFHSAQNLSWQQYSGITAASKHQSIKDLIQRVQYYLPVLKSRTLSADADPYHGRILNMILDDYGSGQLQEYCADLAVGDAIETYHGMRERWNKLKESLDEKDARSNLNCYNELYPVKNLKELLADMTPDRRMVVFDQTGTNQADLDKTHREITLGVIRKLLKGREGNPEPKLSSGHISDHGYLYALSEFEVAGVDVNDDATYTAIDMDRQTFWGNYQKQVAWVTKIEGRTPSKIHQPPPAPQ